MDSDKKKSFHEHYSRLGEPIKAKAELDTELRERMLPADPMLQYFKQKEQEKLGTHGRPTYKGHYPPNRYNIRPGYRWDGVDRSNGHEKRLLAKQAEKKASEEESYRWATRDL